MDHELHLRLENIELQLIRIRDLLKDPLLQSDEEEEAEENVKIKKRPE